MDDNQIQDSHAKLFLIPPRENIYLPKIKKEKVYVYIYERAQITCQHRNKEWSTQALVMIPVLSCPLVA
jgi:hypothetical protein